MEGFMDPVTIRLSHISDFGVYVRFDGLDLDTVQPVAVYVDHHPSTCFWQAWQELGCPHPIDYQPISLTLKLDVEVDCPGPTQG
jgi:hypothetical protein